MRLLKVTNTPLQGVMVVERSPRTDERGEFERTFCAKELASTLGERTIVQINRSKTTQKGTTRGLHLQRPPAAEVKIVSCTRGEIFDVAVDLRRGSPTFLKWHAERLSAENHCSLLIPEGVAHGFQTLTANCELLYMHTHEYAPEHEIGFDVLDPALSISWPILPLQRSERDASFARIEASFLGIEP